MDRREFLRTALGALAGTGLPRRLLADAGDAPKDRPNIVLVMADDLGYGHMGCYGQKLIWTPNVDRLASEGMRFTQAYAGCSVCAPSRSVLMTGLHMGRTPVRANSGGIPLRDEDLTVAEVVKRAGYATGCFGKWGLGDAGTTGVPIRQGFDEFFGYLHQVHAHFYYPEYLWQNDKKVTLPGNADRKRGQYSHDLIVEQALDFIRRNTNRPFFCYVPVTIPHVELVVPEDSMQPYRGRFKEEFIEDPRPGYISSKESFAAFAGMISRLDDGVGRILALLKELSLDARTIVFFTSDNGPQGGPWQRLVEVFNGSGPLRGTKGSFYEGGIRVPMIARWPGRIRAGAVSNHVCYFADIMPTFAELAGVEPPESIDGISVLPTLMGEDAVGRGQRKHEYLYWELASGKQLAQAVRMGDWKGICAAEGEPLALFDLGADLAEQHNLASQHPEIVQRIEAYLKTCRVPPRPQIEPEKPSGQRYC